MNTGKPSEQLFEEAWEACGKHAYCERVEDAAALFGLNKRRVASSKKTSDYLVTHRGGMFYAEVKSTEHPRLFEFKLLKTHQLGRARMILAAGGRYEIFVHSLALQRWYRIPAAEVFRVEETGRRSIAWPDLEEFRWDNTRMS